MKISKTLSGLCLIAACGTGWAAQGDILVTQQGSDLVLELVADETVVATKLAIDFSGVDVSQIDLSACTAGLGSDVVAICEFAGNSLKIGLLQANSKSLPTGEIGRIRVPASNSLSIEVSGGEMVNDLGVTEAVEPLLSIDDLSSGRRAGRRER